ncbi:MAG: ABC transporter substrate-binding protein [Desulfuromonadales bacterium]|nr:ABC transporter substrate-binding protein [Desulfuromonadales bacterium]
MQRATITTFIIFMLTLWPPHAGSTAGKYIAVIMSSDQPRYHDAHQAFIRSLTRRGYPSTSTEIMLQPPNPDQTSWSGTIRKFNARRPDLIVAYGATAALLAMNESNGIPVVSADIYTSEQPVKGMCGVSSRVPMLTLLKTLKSIRPFRTIGILYTAREAGSQRQRDDIRKLAQQLGVTVAEVNAATVAALGTGLTTLIERSDVIIATESSIVCRNFDRIITRTKEYNIPVVATMPESAEKGALISLEISPQEQGHLAAEIAVRVLEGANPEHLSMLKPQRVDLIVNMRTAREMDLHMPFLVLSNATRVLK